MTKRTLKLTKRQWEFLDVYGMSFGQTGEEVGQHFIGMAIIEKINSESLSKCLSQFALAQKIVRGE